MSAYIDTHCHLDLFKDILNNRGLEDIEGIKTVTVTNAPSFFTPNQQLFEDSLNIRVALGLHPQLLTQYKEEISLFEQLVNSTRYIGEIGLDGSADIKDTFLLQKSLFTRILDIVKGQNSKVLTVHSRNAACDTIELLSKYLSNTPHKIILHWYSGSSNDLRNAISKGFYFSINHKMAASEKGKQLINLMPDHLLLTETDAPFTFTKSIDTRLKSLTSTIGAIAVQKNKTPEEIKLIIYENFKNLLS